MANLKLPAYEQNPTKIKFVINQLSSTLDEITKFSGNVVLYGADNTGTVACDAAISAALAASSVLYFPPGIYKVNAIIAYTVAAGKSLTICGAGSSNTVINWPNATNGIGITLATTNANFHIRDLTLTTSQVGTGGTAITVIGGSTAGNAPWSDITNVTISGSDLNPGGAPGTAFWSTGIVLRTSVTDVALYNVNTYGKYGAPGTAGGGIGLTYAGAGPGLTQYATVLNVIACSFNFHAVGVQLGSYWQGVTFINCNFNGGVGTAALQQTGSASGTLSGLWIMGCQFNSGGNQIDINTAIGAVQVVGNIITCSSANAIGLNLNGTGTTYPYYVNVTGNLFNTAGSPTGTFGISSHGNNGTCVANTFSALAIGITLQPTSSLWTVGLNSYTGITSGNVVNSGTNNSVGTAAAGNMAGIVP